MIYAIYNAIMYFISVSVFKISLKLFFRFSVHGHESIPKKGAFIAASNHVSYMDPPAIGATFRRRVYFIASSHLCKNRLLGLWLRSVGCLIIRRGEPDHTTMRRIIRYLKDGKPLAIFPEGSRSEDGKIGESLSGVGFLALKSQAPVIPCFVKGTDKAFPKGAKSFKRTKVSVYIGEAIRPEDFKHEGNRKESYQLFSKKVMHNIAELQRRYAD